MYKYLIEMGDPEGACIWELLHKDMFTQEQFVDKVNSAISKYMIDDYHSTISDYDMDKYIIEYLISTYGFTRPITDSYQAIWSVGWLGIDLKSDDDKHRSCEDMAILTDIRSKINEGTRA